MFNSKIVMILVIGLCLLALMSCVSTDEAEIYEVTAGRVEVKVMDGLTVHSYIMPDGNVSHILETEDSLMILDLVGSEEMGDEYSLYIDSLGKKVSRVYLSHNHDHHMIPVKTLEDVPHYTLESLTASFSELDPDVYAQPNATVSLGTETVNGVEMEYRLNYDSSIMYIVFPGYKIAWIQHLMYSKFHLPLPGAPVEQMISEYRGYDYYLASHGVPGGPDTDEEFLAYQDFVNKAVNDNDNPEQAIEAIEKAYPDWGGAFLLPSMISGAYSN